MNRMTVEELRRGLLTDTVSAHELARRERLREEFIRRRLPMRRFISWMREHGVKFNIEDDQGA